jgi:hypothetical protein
VSAERSNEFPLIWAFQFLLPQQRWPQRNGSANRHLAAAAYSGPLSRLETKVCDGTSGPPVAAQAHTRPLQINLAEHRIRRKQILGRLPHEYQIAA